MAEEHELIKKHTNEAIQALVPLLDNEKTRHVGHVLLKAIDLGLGLLEGDTKHIEQAFIALQKDFKIERLTGVSLINALFFLAGVISLLKIVSSPKSRLFS